MPPEGYDDCLRLVKIRPDAINKHTVYIYIYLCTSHGENNLGVISILTPPTSYQRAERDVGRKPEPSALSQ